LLFQAPRRKETAPKPHLTRPSCRKKKNPRRQELRYGTPGKLQPVATAPGWALRGTNPPSPNPGAPPAPRLIQACGRLQGGKPAAGARRLQHLGGEPRHRTSAPLRGMLKPGGAPRVVPVLGSSPSLAWPERRHGCWGKIKPRSCSLNRFWLEEVALHPPSQGYWSTTRRGEQQGRDEGLHSWWGKHSPAPLRGKQGRRKPGRGRRESRGRTQED